jgi:SAM-dependent methyltransferase
MFNQASVTAYTPGGPEKAYRAEVCNICGSSRFRKILYFREWNLGRDPVRDVSIIQCRRCKVRRRLPGIVDNYEADYHSSYLDQGQAIHPGQLAHFADLMTARLRQFEEKNVKFLDVGCSTGRALRLASALGFESTGLDYSNWAVDYCAKLGFATRQGSLIGQWDKPELFNIIHCCHTIEHVPDPVAYLREMYRLLKPRGQLMLACPNYASLPRIMRKRNWGIWCLDSHLWQFTSRQMSFLLKAAGFKLVSVRTVHGYTPDSLFRQKMLDWASQLGFGDGLNIIATK